MQSCENADTVGFLDGSVNGKKVAFGWVVLHSPSCDQDITSLRPVASKGGCLPDAPTITAAELAASLSLVSFLSSYY
jgi:hypothetical protein